MNRRPWPSKMILLCLAALGAGLGVHKQLTRSDWSDYADLIRNRREVLIQPSNSPVVVERFQEIVRGAHKGKRHGPYESLWINGQPWYRGQYEHGEKVGVWSRFDPSGHKLEERTYEGGRELSVRMFERTAPPAPAVAQQIPAGETAQEIPEFAKKLTEKLGKKGEKAEAEEAPDAVPDFGLLDQHGRFHQLRYYRDARAIVLFVHGVGCPIVRHQAQTLEQLRKDFAARGTRFFMINASPQDDRDELREDAAKLGIQIPILKDETQLVGRDLRLTRTAEVLVIDPRTWTIFYRGPLDDRVGYDTQKPAAARLFLTDALEALLAGRAYNPSQPGELKGCAIQLSDPGPVPDYATEVAPILAARCVGCHTHEGVAPWALEDHEDAHGWSAMIREVVLTRRMPPWFTDRQASSPEAEEIALSNEELRTLVRWIDAGSPRGEGPDPLPAAQPPPKSEDWPLGPPDWIATSALTHLPASGILDWTYVDVELPFDEDKWVRAVHIRPRNLAVLHHGAVLMDYPKHLDHLQPDQEQAITGYFAMYLPGKDPEVYPDGTGVFMPKGSRLRFQLHYTTTGYETSDQTDLAVYFWEHEPQHEMKITSAYEYHMAIPPGAEAHEEVAEVHFDTPTRLYGVFPHMHFRGRSMTFEALHRDGRREQLVSIPYYRYDWQRYYPFTTPKELPAGTKVIARALFDNSTMNPWNPDPAQEVRFGGQSWDEMFVGWIYYVELAERRAGVGEPQPRAL